MGGAPCRRSRRDGWLDCRIVSEERWTAVDEFTERLLQPPDPVLDAALRDSEALPNIAVSPSQGQLLHLLARAIGARRILEIGTLGGYSAIWLGRALPTDGHLLSLEINEEHASVARANIARAGLDGKVEVRVGPALETLATLRADHTEPFDLVFIDADKPNNPGYFAAALELTHVGSLIIVDNVVRKGTVLDESGDANAAGNRKLIEMMGADPRVTPAVIQTVGVKGWDGIGFALVVDG